MPYANDPEMLGIVPCIQCGRRSDKAHCTHCGSYDNRALSTTSKRPDPQTGVMTVVYNYVCRRCGRRYDDFDWKYNCHAPDYIPARSIRNKSQKALKISQQDLRDLEKNAEKLRAERDAKLAKKQYEETKKQEEELNKSKTGEIQ